MITYLPLWKMMELKSVGMMTFPTEWNVMKHVPNHQPVYHGNRDRWEPVWGYHRTYNDININDINWDYIMGKNMDCKLSFFVNPGSC